MNSFDPAKFQGLLRTHSFGRVFHYHPSLDSTNRLLKDLAQQGAAAGTVVLADEQTAGRGRWGRHWESPANSSLLVSLLLHPDRKVAQGLDSQLTAVLGVAVLRCVNRLPLAVLAKLKWPNDLWVDGRKLSGLLLEGAGGSIVAGLGLNCGQSEADLPPGLEATSLKLLTGQDCDREALLAETLLEMERCYEAWMSGGFDAIRAEWDQNACFIGEMVRSGETKGRMVGLDHQGALILETPQGMTTLHSGEVRALRPL